jgi:hypothetical protein
MKKLVIVLAALALFVGAASADCPELIEVDCGGGSAWFGLRHDGANIGQGQSFFLECNSLLLSVETIVRNNGLPNSGVPPMVAGDPIYCVIADLEWSVYASSVAAMPFDVGESWVSFDFNGDGIPLDAGTYLWLLYTDVPRQAAIIFCPGGDSYPDGERYSSLDGLNGPWYPNSGTIDDPFRVWLMPITPVEDETWGSVKAMFK